MPRSPIRRRTARRAAELALVAPQVVALRMLNGGGDRRETRRMFTEKGDAFARSLTAMQMQWMRAAFELPLVLMRDWSALWLAPWTAIGGRRRSYALDRHFRNAMARALDSGITPVHRTATANLRRLSRRR